MSPYYLREVSELQGTLFVSFLHTLQGDLKKAKEHILFAKSIDPLNPETKFYETNYLYRAGEYANAKEILDELLEANDRNLPAIVLNTYILIQENRLQEARAAIKNLPEETFTPDEQLGLLALIDAKSEGPTATLTELGEHAKDPRAHHAHSYLFVIYAILGQYDEAFKILEWLFDAKSSILLLGFSDPLAEQIQSDPRYLQFHHRIYPSIDETKVKKAKPKVPGAAVAFAQVGKLKAYLETDSPYLNPRLTLRSLADQIDVHPNQLSWLLNEHVGKNFNEFINEKRIEYFKKLVVDPDNSHISLIGLAYESGFNSKTVFNTTFKKEVGMTPKEFQKSQS